MKFPQISRTFLSILANAMIWVFWVFWPMQWFEYSEYSGQCNDFDSSSDFQFLLSFFRTFGNIPNAPIGISFTLACKGYDNHHCHDKPQTGDEAGVWMMSCPEEMGWEFEDFERESWMLTLDHAGWKLSSCHWVGSWELDFDLWRCSWVFRISTDRDLKHHGMRSMFVGSDSMVNIVRIVSLSSYWRNEVRS